MHFGLSGYPFDFYCEYWSLFESKKFRYIYVIYFFKFGMIYKRLARNAFDRWFLPYQSMFIHQSAY
ncbi:hypothetical protein F0228_06670 [Vibrio sp. 99K-1]|nr:hypothetical protein [Vibrio sp. 99K-1]NOI93471.1 hypothetical protein [Vibrio sp. T3Y01]PQJ51409.1 hypothetical protein BTO12_15935 [Vibrio splendidus]